MKVIKLISVLLLSSLLGLMACDGGGGSSAPIDTGSTVVLNGTFIDSALSGIRYKTRSGLTGITDSAGSYKYSAGDTVTFYLGDLIIGNATATGVLTPISLVPGAKDETNPTVTNIARFLQSLDMDNDPANGIVISPTVATAATAAVAAGIVLDFTATTVNFESQAGPLVVSFRTAAYGDSNTLVTAVAAQQHFKTTLLQARVGFYAGTYVEIGGPDNGSWAIEVKMDGTVSGCLNSLPAAKITGSVATSGVASTIAGNTTTGATFTGDFSLNGLVKGTWKNIADAANGSYSGSKTTVAPVCSTGMPGNNNLIVGTWMDTCVIDNSNPQITIARRFYVKFLANGVTQTELWEVPGTVCSRPNNVATIGGTYSIANEVTLSTGQKAIQVERINTTTTTNGVTLPLATTRTIKNLILINGDVMTIATSADNTVYPVAADVEGLFVLTFFRQP